MLNIINALVAIKVIIETIYKLLKAMQQTRVALKEKSNINSVKKANEKHDQLDIEEAIGSGNAGKPTSNREGVQQRPRQNRG